jgi:GxxExxY protein
VPIVYHGQNLDCGYRADLIIEDEVLVELKCVQKLLPVHRAQVLSHLRFAKRRVGLLLNFNVRILTAAGIKRIVNGFPD